MLKRPVLMLALTLCPLPGLAQGVEGIDWHLLAIDGAVVDAAFVATLHIGADGWITGQAPCNSYDAENLHPLPGFQPGPIRATKMACDQLAAEVTFFNALSAMTALTGGDGGPLVLTGADGRSMEFVPDRAAPDTVCTTCAP